jgi:hypothetical protein
MTVDEAERLASTFRPLWESAASSEELRAALVAPVEGPLQQRDEPALDEGRPAAGGRSGSRALASVPEVEGLAPASESRAPVGATSTSIATLEAPSPVDSAQMTSELAASQASFPSASRAPLGLSSESRAAQASPPNVAARVVPVASPRHHRSLGADGAMVTPRSTPTMMRLFVLGAVFAVVGALVAWLATGHGGRPNASLLIEAERPTATPSSQEILAPEPSVLPPAAALVLPASIPTALVVDATTAAAPPVVDAAVPAAFPPTVDAAAAASTAPRRAFSIPARRYPAPTVVAAPPAATPARDTKSSIVRDAPF